MNEMNVGWWKNMWAMKTSRARALLARYAPYANALPSSIVNRLEISING